MASEPMPAFVRRMLEHAWGARSKTQSRKTFAAPLM